MNINIPIQIIPPTGLIYPSTTELPDPTSPRELLKAFTTKNASKYLVENRIIEPYTALYSIQTYLDENHHHFRFKGGLALKYGIKLIITNLLDNNEELTTEYLDNFGSYIAASDIDTTLFIDETINNNNFENILDIISQEILDQLTQFRNNPSMINYLNGIIRLCNTDIDGKNKLFQQGIKNVKFSIHQQQDIVVNKRGQNIIVNSISGNEIKSIYLSNNKTLDFDIGEEKCHFNLIRAKFSIKAEFTDNNNNIQTVTCPAELIDISIPKRDDFLYQEFWNHHQNDQIINFSFYDGQVSINSVNLNYQLHDIERMLHFDHKKMLQQFHITNLFLLNLIN